MPPEPKIVAEPFAWAQVVFVTDPIELAKAVGCVIEKLLLPVQPFVSRARMSNEPAVRFVNAVDVCQVLPPLTEYS